MVPILGALVLQAAYGAVDLFGGRKIRNNIGTFGGIHGQSGAQSCNLCHYAVSMGITVLIARYIGEKKPQYIGALIGSSMLVFTIISVVLFVVYDWIFHVRLRCSCRHRRKLSD